MSARVVTNSFLIGFLNFSLSWYRIAGKFGEHYIWRISQWIIFGVFNFDDDLPAGLASRLSSCTYIMYRYRYICAATKDWRVYNLTTPTQVRQTAKINSSPNFPATTVFFLKLLSDLHTTLSRSILSVFQALRRCS